MRGILVAHERVPTGADCAVRARGGTSMSLDHTEAHLAAEARYATDRVALYQQRMYTGTGEARRLAELERAAAGGTERLRAHEAAFDVQPASSPPRQDLASALEDVGVRLEADGLPTDE